MLILRHGESEFNAVYSATGRDPGIADARLTPRGHAQAARAATVLAARGIARILVSPYTRAIETGLHVAAVAGIAVEVTQAVREQAAFACDVGTPRGQLAARFPELDFSALEEVWWAQAGETRDAVALRARAFLDAMRARPDHAGTVVVCHWGFALALTGCALDNAHWVEIAPDGTIRA